MGGWGEVWGRLLLHSFLGGGGGGEGDLVSGVLLCGICVMIRSNTGLCICVCIVHL
jgi:hypothetical protein